MKGRSMILVAVFAAVVAGCATGPDARERYQLQVEMYREDQRIKAESREFYAKIAQGCKDDTCRTTIALTATLDGASGAGGTTNQRPQYTPDRNYVAEFGLAALSTLPVIGSTLVAMRQSDNSVKMNRDQFSAWSSIIGDITAGVDGLQPNINIEGGYIGGDVSGNGAGIGNSFAVSGSGNAIGDGNAIDNRRGQVNGNWNNNSGRAMSPGPYRAGNCVGGSASGDTGNGGNGGNCPAVDNGGD